MRAFLLLLSCFFLILWREKKQQVQILSQPLASKFTIIQEIANTASVAGLIGQTFTQTSCTAFLIICSTWTGSGTKGCPGKAEKFWWKARKIQEEGNEERNRRLSGNCWFHCNRLSIDNDWPRSFVADPNCISPWRMLGEKPRVSNL